MKSQVIDNVPKKIGEVQFGVMYDPSPPQGFRPGSDSDDCRSSQDVVKQGVVEVATRELYDLDGGRTLKKNGALDARMVGPTRWLTPCEGMRSLKPGRSNRGSRRNLVPAKPAAKALPTVMVILVMSSLRYQHSTSVTSRRSSPCFRTFARTARGYYWTTTNGDSF